MFAATAMVCGGLLMGCGGGADDADPNLVPVTGTVTLDGQPVSQGTITFMPDGQGGKVSTGQLDASGNYVLKASPSAPGALPGNYKVRIEAWKTAPTMDKDGNPVPGESLVPEKYANVGTSGLTATVKEAGEKIDFALKSK